MTEEDRLQLQVAAYLRVTLTDRQCIWWHTPNGGVRSKATAGRLKAAGVRAGIPDLLFLLPGGRLRAIELKTRTGRLSPAQRELLAAWESLTAVPVEVCRSLDEVIECLDQWGLNPAQTVDGPSRSG